MEEIKKNIKKHLKWNVTTQILESFFIIMCAGVSRPYIILFIKKLYKESLNLPPEQVLIPNDIVGYFQIFVCIGALLPMLFTSIFTEDINNKRNAILVLGFFNRIRWLLLIAVVFLLSGYLRLILAIILFSLGMISSHSAMIPKLDLDSRVFPVEMRGRFEAARSFIEGIGFVLGTLLLKEIFNPRHQQTILNFWNSIFHNVTDVELGQYGVSFIFAMIFAFLSYLMIYLIREVRYPTKEKVNQSKMIIENKIVQFKTILKKDVNFRQYLISRCLLVSTFYIVALYPVYVTENLGFSKSVWANLNILAQVLMVVSFLVWGAYGDRKGWRKVLIALGLLSVMVPGFYGMSGLFKGIIPLSLGMLIIAQSMAGLTRKSLFKANQNIIFEFSGYQIRTSYIGLSNILAQTYGIFIALLILLFVDKISIEAVFIIAVLMQLMGCYMLIRMKEPRFHKAPELT